ncbi:LysR family transcriptional regulator [Ilyobacter polytropus]|uniref:Transcriptional regulator, LysR family n=1 Tax=Ilyobacter polytropus (strain ATCC 51220 / DSM 2926 / LMG 16218 / CuHBu1) TaxID=572544 RepID=E3H6F5_ILYPC|nr:LysR family transcriptional regulator [Ilyobacter polytropus]ADO82368.1 transcriptional regulator, LysR family [Ilyobacter polytropus DSM 2926]
MDLHYLRIFYEVAKERSFTKAANKLYINQSAVSIQVKKFEELLNTKLFDRSSKKIKLTYSGEVLYKMAEEIFQKVKRAEKEMTRIIELDKAKISIGSTSTVGEPLIPKLMKAFSKVHSEIEYDIIFSDKQRLLKSLKEGELDVIIIDEEHITDSNLEVIEVDKFPYVLVSKEDYRDIEDVIDTPLISRKTIPNNNEAIAALENKYKISFDNQISVMGSLETIKGMVREGVGNVILPYYSVYKEVEAGEFKIIEKIEEVEDAYQIVITKDKRTLLEIIKFINFTQNFKII